MYHRTSVSASFYRNVFLLTQLAPPSDDFKKYFREGMFDKPNVAGFVHVSHYLLMICDAERFKKIIEWPVICKKSEAKYRNDVKDYLSIISLENPDIGFPPILTTYLHHASGTKFIIIMWKLSQFTLQRYLMRTSNHNVLFAPKLDSANDTVKIYLQQSKAIVAQNISSCHRNYSRTQEDVTPVLIKEKEELAKIKTELFDRKQFLAKYVTAAPVAAPIKEHLANVENLEVTQMWKSSLAQSTYYIRKRVAIVKDLERICEKINGIIPNLSNNAKTLNSKQLKKIDCSLISELPFFHDVQRYLYHLYHEDKLVYHNFICLFVSILRQMYQCLKKSNPKDLSPCLLQIKASVEDMKSVHDVLKMFLMTAIKSTEEAQNVLCERNMTYINGESTLPLVKSVLLMPSPLIKINTNCTDEKNDLLKLLQFTPGEREKEVMHKSLFSKHMRYVRSHTPDLRTNLFVSRISIDETVPLGSINNEKQNFSTQFVTPKMNRFYKRTNKKYSRLFCTCANKSEKANCSVMSLPYTTQANSSTIANSAGEIVSLSDLNLDITATGFFNLSGESLASAQITPVKQNISQDTTEKTKNVLNRDIKVSKPVLDELTEVQFVSGNNNDAIVMYENTSRRRSISDLIERYKQVLENSSCAMLKFQSECM